MIRDPMTFINSLFVLRLLGPHWASYCKCASLLISYIFESALLKCMPILPFISIFTFWNAQNTSP